MSIKSLQQRYLLKINGVDVTSAISGEITYESNQEVVGSLNFTLSGRDFIIPNKKGGGSGDFSAKDVVKLYDDVYFEGGAGLDGSYNYAPIFRGIIKHLNPQYENSGLLKVSVECVDYSYKLLQNKNYNFYPDSKSTKEWARKSPLKASEIVRGLAIDTGLVIGKDSTGAEDIRLLVDKEYTYKSPITQRNETEWQVIKKIAKRLNCHFWTEYDSDGVAMHFADDVLLRDDESGSDEIVFVYPLRTEANSGFQYSKLGRNEVPIWSVSVTHDVAEMNATTRVVTQFDYATGEEMNYLSHTEETSKGAITSYYKLEVDESKTSKVAPEEIDRLKEMAGKFGTDQISTADADEIVKYLKPAEFWSDRHNFLVDKPRLGITITCTCEGNIHIKGRKNYRVKGIGRFGSDNLEHAYYLRKLTHTWGSSGFLTQMEFYK